LILFFTIPCALIYPAPAKTTAPPAAQLKKAPLPKVAVLVSFDGYADFYEFTASQDNYNLSAVYQSLSFQLSSYSTNLTFVGTDKMLYLPLSAYEDKKAIDTLEVDYLIKLNLIKYGKFSTLEIGALQKDGNWLVKYKIVLKEKISAGSLDEIFVLFNKTIDGILLDVKAQNLKKLIGGTNYIFMTNYNHIIETNTISSFDFTGAYLIKNNLHIIGDFQYLELISSYKRDYYKQGSQGFNTPVSIYPGLNFIRVSYNNPQFIDNSWEFKNEQIFLINNISLTNSYLTLAEYNNVPVTHFFLSIGMKYFLSIREPLLDLDIGFRFALSSFQKIKFALTIIQTYYRFDYYGYYSPNLGIKIGYENMLGKTYSRFDYAFCWFADAIASFSQIGINSGISLRADPILSINAGIGVQYIPASFFYYSRSSDSWDFCLFIQYEMFAPIPQAYKNYELNY
jgi:hypothetical protein